MFRFWSATTLAVLVVATAAAQAPKAAPAGSKDFKQLFAEWKDVLAQLQDLRERYPVAGRSEKQQLEAEYERLIEKGREMVPQMARAAEQTYRAAPNQDSEVVDFLLSSLADSTKQGDYKEALRIAKLLIDHNAKEKNKVYSVAGVAAMAANDPATARKYFQSALDAKALDASGKKYLDELAVREKEAKANDLPRVKLNTNKGDIVIELFENEAPNTVANFISLVEKGFYNGIKFHRVIPGFMAQGGDPEGTGTGGPGYTIACECYRPDARLHFPGTLSMAHAGPDTGGSQFFLTFGETAHLDRKHTAFGRVIDGMQVLNKLQATEGPRAGEPDRIVKAVVVRKRSHEYVPQISPK